jgi:uncharacterized coiled-coil protein SlyX
MVDQNIDVNLIIQAFQDRVAQLTSELVLKEATIKHLNNYIIQNLENVKTNDKKEKKEKDDF